ncbi:AAA family ATPase [Brenneria goodwinii]|uniref:AAA family ATPase n=1 Tax=Brenneria goodwinii TaxID=1109412 RepID=UPI0036E4CA11
MFHPDVTFFVGENGSGKSTLLEAIAVAMGFNAEGGPLICSFLYRGKRLAVVNSFISQCADLSI